MYNFSINVSDADFSKNEAVSIYHPSFIRAQGVNGRTATNFSTGCREILLGSYRNFAEGLAGKSLYVNLSLLVRDSGWNTQRIRNFNKICTKIKYRKIKYIKLYAKLDPSGYPVLYANFLMSPVLLSLLAYLLVDCGRALDEKFEDVEAIIISVIKHIIGRSGYPHFRYSDLARIYYSYYFWFILKQAGTAGMFNGDVLFDSADVLIYSNGISSFSANCSNVNYYKFFGKFWEENLEYIPKEVLAKKHSLLLPFIGALAKNNLY